MKIEIDTKDIMEEIADKFDAEDFLKDEKYQAFKEYVEKCDKNEYVSYPKFESKYNLKKWLKQND